MQFRRMAVCHPPQLPNYAKLTFDMQMLAGCDYLQSIQGIGIKTAHTLLRRHKTVEKVRVLISCSLALLTNFQLLQAIRLDGALVVPNHYAASFAQAELAFIYQRVFDPRTKRLVTLNDVPDEGLTKEDERWIGLYVFPQSGCRGLTLCEWQGFGTKHRAGTSIG